MSFSHYEDYYHSYPSKTAAAKWPPANIMTATREYVTASSAILSSPATVLGGF